jgi:quinol monooxygenase YgiN
MMGKYGMYVKFTAHEGKRDELVEALLEAATLMKTVTECELYVVNVSDTEPDTVWVNEAWTNAEAHQASLAMEETRQLIQRAMPLVAGAEQIKIVPVGGKGIQ